MNKYIFVCRLFLWVIFLSLNTLTGYSQTFVSKTYTTENGLCNNFVQHISQDKTGFLWISTWDGLSRYDGFEFKNYFHKPEDTTTVPFFVVDKTVVDASNNVWAMCQQRAVVIYNRSTDSFERLKVGDLDELIIYDMTSGPDSTIWLYSRNSNLLYHFDGYKKLLSKFRLVGEEGTDNFITNFAPQVLIDNKGGFWFISIINRKYEVFRGTKIDDKTIKLYSVNVLPIEITGDESGFKTLAMYDILVDDNGKIMLFSKFGLFYYNTSIKQFIETDSSVITGKLSGKQYYFWSSEQSGIHVLDAKQNRVVSIEPEPGKFIENLFIDRQGTIWSADYLTNREDIGLNRYVPTPSYFKYYLNGEHKYQKKTGNKIPGKLIAMRGIETIFNFYNDNSFSNISIPKVNGKLPQVNSMASDSLGAWLGCSDNLLLRYNFKNNEFTPHILKPEGDIENNDMRIHNILREGNNLIINAKRAIYRFNIKNEKLTSEYIHEPNAPCFSMVDDDKGGYWIGVNSNTIKHLGPDFKELATFRFNKGMNNVEHICLGDSSDVWVALMGGGLGHLYPQTGKMEIFTTANGLGNNTLLSILKDKNGNLWISTIKGISFFNTRTRLFRNFGKTEGILMEEFISDANYLATDGEMFFGWVGGMVGFYPDSVIKYINKKDNSKLLITEFNVSGIPRFFKKPIYELDNVMLKKGDNNFQLTFACLDFRNSEKIKYRYRLAGNDNSWTFTDNRQRNINYANLDPGKYKVEIEATNNFGDWDLATALNVTIPAFFYQTLWFRILISFALVSIITIGFIVYNRQIRLNAKQKQNELRLESLRSQMNPHFIFNALNSVNYFNDYLVFSLKRLSLW